MTALPVEQTVADVLRSVLQLDAQRLSAGADTPLLGSIPELDSMAVVSILTAIEERFDFAVDDDEIDSATFATFGSLCRFVQTKLGQ